jgi:DNA polymerase III epsilon subunit-like protein
VFDLPILRRHAQDCGYPHLRHARYLDTYLLAKALLPGKQAGRPNSRKLATLYEFYTGIVPVGNHRAAADCEYNREVLVHLLRHMQLPGAGPGPPGDIMGERAGSAAAKWLVKYMYADLPLAFRRMPVCSELTARLPPCRWYLFGAPACCCYAAGCQLVRLGGQHCHARG